MEGIRGTEHPLQTPIVLDCIFKNLVIADLKECRQVCRAWRDESGKSMRAFVAVRIQCNKPDTRGPSKFLELVKSDESTFFQAPFADTFKLMKGVADYPEFWKTCGSHIKSLILQNVTFSSADTFRHAIFQCCPNLEKLRIADIQVSGEPAPEPEPKEWLPPQFTPNLNLKTLSFWLIRNEFSVGWLEILSQFPCLEDLLVDEMEDHYEDIFRALDVARQHDATCWKLKEVGLIGGGLPPITFPPAFVRVFGREGGLALISLTICGIAGDTEEDVTTVQNLVVAHAQSLKKLAITQNSDDFPPETDIFPLPGNLVLENIHALKLIGVRMRSTRFLQAFPNLKKLSLEVDEIPEDTQTPHVTLDDCTELIFHNRMHVTEDFKRLFDLLPNLKKLQINSLDNVGFSMVCQYWPDLTHLELANAYDVSEMEVNDAGISGFDRKYVKKINKKRREGAWRPITVRRANLSSLKNLESFFWRVSSEQYRNVGYCSKACGILELPELKHLRVEREREQGTRRGLTDFEPMFESLFEQFPWDDKQEITFD